MNGNKDNINPISLSVNFILQVLQDSWLGCITTNSERLNEEQFVLMCAIGSGKHEGLLYINGQLQNIPPSTIIPEHELARIVTSIAVKFPSTLEEFKLKCPHSVIIALYNYQLENSKITINTNDSNIVPQPQPQLASSKK
jgi:hypothetical protein